MLGLALEDSGFDYSVLSEFRSRLIEGRAEHMLLGQMLAHFRERGLLSAGGRQRTGSTHVLAAVRSLNRMELVGETMRATLNMLANVAPDWLREQVPIAWYERYNKHIGQDGASLLKAIDETETLPWLKQLPCVDILRTVWQQQYSHRDGQWTLRSVAELDAAGERINTPYDPQAHYAIKRGMGWTGYKVHLTGNLRCGAGAGLDPCRNHPRGHPRCPSYRAYSANAHR